MKYMLHVITPVHVGNGVRLGRMDYIKRGDRLIVVDIQKLAALPEIDPEELSDRLYLSEFNMEEFLREMKIDPARVMAYSVDCRCHPQGDVLSCIKDGTGMAYIPGSSIKGALRTAILWERIKNSPEKREEAISKIAAAVNRARSRGSKADAAKELEELFLGKDPNHDHLRALRVSDTGLVPTNSLGIFNVDLLSLTGGNALRNKMDLFVEAIKPGTRSWVSIDPDEFLRRNASKLDMNTDDLGEKELEKIVRAYCSDYVKSEIKFFSDYSSPADDSGKDNVRDFYNKLLELPEKRGGMVLRIGWGGGWHGMTVARLFPELLDTMRREFRLGRTNIKEFPKTRRLAVLEASRQPMGWIWLKRDEGG